MVITLTSGAALTRLLLIRRRTFVHNQATPTHSQTEQTPDTADTVTCSVQPETRADVFMNAAATISTADHRQRRWLGWLGLVSGGGWKS